MRKLHNHFNQQLYQIDFLFFLSFTSHTFDAPASKKGQATSIGSSTADKEELRSSERRGYTHCVRLGSF